MIYRNRVKAVGKLASVEDPSDQVLTTKQILLENSLGISIDTNYTLSE